MKKNNRKINNKKKYHKNNRMTVSKSKEALYSTGIFMAYHTMEKNDVIAFSESSGLILPEHTSEQTATEKVREMIAFIDSFKKRNYTKRGIVNKRTYKTIYAHRLKFMVPRDVKHSLEEYIRAFMKEFLPKNGEFLWEARTYKINGIRFMDIMAFTRPILKNSIHSAVRYDSDYYWNKNTKKRASFKQFSECNDGSVVLLHRKGEVKKDADGKPVKNTLFCAFKEAPLFKYRRKNDNTNISGFEVMIENFKGILAGVIARIDSGIDYTSRIIKKESYTKGKNRPSTMLKIILKNRVISRINVYLTRIQKCFIEAGYFEDKKISQKYYSLLRKLNKICHGSSITYQNVTLQMNYRGFYGAFQERILFMKTAAGAEIGKFFDFMNTMLFKKGFLPEKPEPTGIVAL